MTSDRSGNIRRAMAGCIDRRRFLILSGTAVSVLATVRANAAAAGDVLHLVMSAYPAKRITSLSKLGLRTPVAFAYPSEEVQNFVVMLGEPAGAGIGPNQDVVAFNTMCTHMGGPVGPDAYKPELSLVGPCPLHLTTFDLTKHGMVVSGHATESLPQIALELRDDDLYAVGVMGLMYGHSINPAAA